MLPSAKLTAMNTITYSQPITNVTARHAGVYICTARVFYNGTASPVTNSNSISSNTTLNITGESNILNIIYITSL